MNNKFSPVHIDAPDARATTSQLSPLIANLQPYLVRLSGKFNHDMMDDMSDFGITQAARDRLTDDQVEALTEMADKAARAEAMAEMRYELRRVWSDAIGHQNAPSTPQVPTVEGRCVVMVPITAMVGNLLDAAWSVQLVADSLRTGDTTNLHQHLRHTYIEAYAADLLALGWQP